MKRFFRLLAWTFAFLAAYRLYLDVERTVLQDRAFRMQLAGEVWAGFDRASLLNLQPAVERYLSPRLWEWVVFPILQTPLLPMLVIVALFFFVASARRPTLR